MDKKTRSILILCAVLFLLIIGYLYVFTPTSDEKRAKTALSGPEKTSVITVDQQSQKQETVRSGEITPVASDKHFNRVDAASAAVNNPDISARFRAILSLRQELSPEAIDILSQFLNDTDVAVVSEAIDALGFIGLNNSDLEDLVFQILEEKAKDKDFSAAGHALITAAMLTEDNRILPVILDYVSEEDEGLKAFAARAMSFIANPECIAIANHRLPKKGISVVATSPAAHEVFGTVLQRHDTEKKDKIFLLKLLADNAWMASKDVRSGIVDSALLPLLDSEDTDLEIEAIKTLGKLGAGENTADVLIPKLQSENFLVQENALDAFARFCTPRTYKPLLELYWDDDEKIRRRAFVLSERFLNSSELQERSKGMKTV